MIAAVASHAPTVFIAFHMLLGFLPFIPSGFDVRALVGMTAPAAAR
jgi:hypothetical protein